MRPVGYVLIQFSAVSLGLAVHKEITKHDGIVVLVIVSGIEQRNGAFLDEIGHELHFLFLVLKLLRVAPAELLPTIRLMIEPVT